MSLNNHEVYADGSELDLSPQTKKKETLRHNERIPNFTRKTTLANEDGPIKDQADEMENDVIKLLDHDAKAVSISSNWEPRNNSKYDFVTQISNFPMGSQRFPQQIFGINTVNSDIHTSHGRSQSQFNMQGGKNDGVYFNYVSPQPCKIPSKNIVSALSTETTFDGDFLANNEHLNTSYTTVGTYISGASKKNSENFQTPSKSGSETKLYNVNIIIFRFLMFFISEGGRLSNSNIHQPKNPWNRSSRQHSCEKQSQNSASSRTKSKLPLFKFLRSLFLLESFGVRNS